MKSLIPPSQLWVKYSHCCSSTKLALTLITLEGVIYLNKITKSYKNLFLRKKWSWPRAGLDLAGVENGEIMPDSAVPRSDILFLKYYSDHEYDFGDANWRNENLSQKMGFVTHFINGAPQEIKLKINESRLLKFYSENSTERIFNGKKIQPRILQKRNLMNSETFR